MQSQLQLLEGNGVTEKDVFKFLWMAELGPTMGSKQDNFWQIELLHKAKLILLTSEESVYFYKNTTNGNKLFRLLKPTYNDHFNKIA